MQIISFAAIAALVLIATICAVVQELLKRKGSSGTKKVEQIAKIICISAIIGAIIEISLPFISLLIFPAPPTIIPQYGDNDTITVALDNGSGIFRIYYTINPDPNNPYATTLYENPIVISETSTIIVQSKFWIFSGSTVSEMFVVGSSQNDYVFVDSIKMDKEAVSLEVGAEYLFNAMVEPDNATDRDNLLWYSENDNVATIDENGLVTAKKSGTTTITVIDRARKASSQCIIEVTNPNNNHRSNSLAQFSNNASVQQPISVTSIQITNSPDFLLGMSTQINVDIQPGDALNKELYWSSSDINVATVDNYGLVRVVGWGICTITVTSAENSNVSSSLVVSVPEPEISDTSITLSTLSDYKLTIYNCADCPVNWYSSYESVASVDSYGCIHAWSDGQCMIIAKIKDISLTCYVTVIDPSPMWIDIENPQYSLSEGECARLFATVYPLGAEQNVIWTSNNPSVVSIENDGYLYGVSEGSATIFVCSELDCSISSSFEIVVRNGETRTPVITSYPYNPSVGEYDAIDLLYDVDAEQCSGDLWMEIDLGTGDPIIRCDMETGKSYTLDYSFYPYEYEMTPGAEYYCRTTFYYNGQFVIGYERQIIIY